MQAHAYVMNMIRQKKRCVRISKTKIEKQNRS